MPRIARASAWAAAYAWPAITVLPRRLHVLVNTRVTGSRVRSSGSTRVSIADALDREYVRGVCAVHADAVPVPRLRAAMARMQYDMRGSRPRGSSVRSRLRPIRQTDCSMSFERLPPHPVSRASRRCVSAADRNLGRTVLPRAARWR
jgi:hypothetical protein